MLVINKADDRLRSQEVCDRFVAASARLYFGGEAPTILGVSRNTADVHQKSNRLCVPFSSGNMQCSATVVILLGHVDTTQEFAEEGEKGLRERFYILQRFKYFKHKDICILYKNFYGNPIQTIYFERVDIFVLNWKSMSIL